MEQIKSVGIFSENLAWFVKKPIVSRYQSYYWQRVNSSRKEQEILYQCFKQNIIKLNDEGYSNFIIPLTSENDFLLARKLVLIRGFSCKNITLEFVLTSKKYLLTVCNPYQVSQRIKCADKITYISEEESEENKVKQSDYIFQQSDKIFVIFDWQKKNNIFDIARAAYQANKPLVHMQPNAELIQAKIPTLTDFLS